MSDLDCPSCGAVLDLAVVFASAEDRQALARLAAASIPLGARVLRYIALHKPAKQNLTSAKKIKLILQLLPDLERKAISHKGREWAAPLDAWAIAIDQMLAQGDAGRLELPLKGHTYLYAVIAGMADKVEAAAEAKRESDQRTAGRAHSSGAPTNVADLVNQPTPRQVPAPAVAYGQSPAVRAMRAEIAQKRSNRNESA